MNASSKVLFLGGWLLVLLGMGYGLWYAVFDEHQTLEHMGMSLAESFTQAAERNLSASDLALTDYAETGAEYVREVHAHAHWILLAMVMIALGLAFDQVKLSEKMRLALAWLMFSGSALFPAGVLLQNFSDGLLAQAMAVGGAVAVIVALTGTAFGFLRRRNREQAGQG